MTELLPCPFCGESVEVVRAHVAGESDWIRHLSRVGSPDCGISDFDNFNAEQPVEVLWNARLSPTPNPINTGAGA